jgi:branched-subunit amino acid aminotransferase/4-amino-4-deoxychorismate lyase
MQTIERTTLREAVYRTIAIVSPGEFRIRIVLTRGSGGLGQAFAELGRGRAIVIVEALPEQPTELSLAVVDWPVAHRQGHKTLAYLDPVIARELARAAGADEAVRLDGKGHVVEGATCNVFLVERGAVATPRLDEGALPGIVRVRVLEACAREQITGTERLISLRDLRGADEIFVTSSLRGVVAVTRLDGVARQAGPITAILGRAYTSAMRAAP